MSSTAPTLPLTIEFPAIWCPIPARAHPNAAGIEDRLLAWARRSDLIRTQAAADRFYDAGFGRFAADVYPRATQLELTAEWTGYNWIVDDQLDEGRVAGRFEERERIARELMAQMPLDLHAPRPATPLAAALSDLWQRTAKPFSWAWRERFTSHYRDFLAFSVLPYADLGRPDTAPPELTPFIRRRRIDSGCEMSFDLIEVANSVEVPHVVADSDPYRAVRLAANDAIGWTNDIFSVWKETARGDHEHLVAVLRQATGSTWEEALAQAADMVADLTRDFLCACRDLRSMRRIYGLDEPSWALVEESLTDLGEWISGSLAWHWKSPRYRDVVSTPDGETPAYIEHHLV